MLTLGEDREACKRGHGVSPKDPGSADAAAASGAVPTREPHLHGLQALSVTPSAAAEPSRWCHHGDLVRSPSLLRALHSRLRLIHQGCDQASPTSRERLTDGSPCPPSHGFTGTGLQGELGGHRGGKANPKPNPEQTPTPLRGNRRLCVFPAAAQAGGHLGHESGGRTLLCPDPSTWPCQGGAGRVIPRDFSGRKPALRSAGPLPPRHPVR